MVAARSPSARFVFIERDPVLAALCECNIKRQSIDGAVIAADVLDKVARTAGPLRDIRADLVLTNPPFLDEERSRVSPDANRAAAHSLPAGGLDAWLRACAALLEPKGMLVLIHRSDRIADCVAALSGRVGGLALRFVHPGAGEPAIRVIISGVKGSRAPLRILPPVFLHQADGAFTAQAAAIHQGEAYLA
jgi:tRNA1(Val) A37 N6-methylase TrmN6